jgi:DNA-directed RNA polymerase omega subunit
LKAYGEIGSKFRFVILASKRAKQLLQGSKPRIKSKSKNPIRIAQKEVRDGFVGYELVEVKKEEIQEPAEEGFIGEEIGAGLKEMEGVKTEAPDKEDEKPEKEPKKKQPVKKTTEAKKKKPVKKSDKKSEKKKTT